jgi:enoyl-CoA hydratase/carnithine racemase
MSYQYLIVETNSGLTQISINRPQIMNALSPASLAELKKAVLEAGQNPQTAVIVITGAGKAFAAGADLQSLDQKLENGRVGAVIDEAANSVIEAIQSTPKVVIAMVNGHCYTGALEIVLACDLIVASENARFGDTHVRFGLRPSWGMSQRLPRAVGYYKAKELSFTARIIDAREAERIGLVNQTVPADKLAERVRELASEIQANSLEAVAAYKSLYNQSMRGTMAQGLEMERTRGFSISDTTARIDSFRKTTG